MITKLKLIASLTFLFILFSCGQKKKAVNPEEGFFPIVKFLQSEAAAIDTSLYSIMKVQIKDTTAGDTIYIRREDFHKEARDFLTLPDLSEDQYHDRYTESKQFDETINRAIVVYIPVKASNEKIQREEILFNLNGEPTNVIINYVSNTRDSSIRKQMLWQIDESFQVTTMRQLPGQPETISTLKVLWNGKEGK